MSTEQLRQLPLRQDPREPLRAQQLRGVLTEISLRHENALYANTRGISQRNRSNGFRPGYLNRVSGETVLSRFADGSLAPIHVLDGLPHAWIVDRDADGRAIKASAEVISGFLRDGVFYTREEAIRATAH